MAKISKDINEPEEKKSDEIEIDQENLTPWQKENLEYMKKQGDDPVWHPSLLRRKPTEETQQEDDSNQGEALEEEDPDQSIEIDQEADKKKPSYESFADRLPNIKKERNQRLYRRLTLIVSVLLIAVLISLYFVSPLSKLGSINVVGNSNIDSEILIKQSGLEKGKGLWEQLWDRGVYEKKIQRGLPRVRKASISLSGINSFKIKINEYKVVALESEGEEYHPILENGKILNETLHVAESGKPIFENFQDESLIKELMISYADLSTEIKHGISEIKYAPSVTNKELVSLYMNDGNRVLVNIPQLSEKMAYYPQVAKQMDEAGIIDMEVGIFSYPYGNESTAESTDDNSQSLEENY